MNGKRISDKTLRVFGDILDIVGILPEVLYLAIDWIVTYTAKTLNIFLRLDWKNNLNTFQNIFLNIYLVTSRGERSMHTTILTLIVGITSIALLAEIQKFVFMNNYQLSNGFWGVLGVFVAIVQGLFTKHEENKLLLTHKGANPQENNNYTENPKPEFVTGNKTKKNKKKTLSKSEESKGLTIFVKIKYLIKLLFGKLANLFPYKWVKKDDHR